jgi:type VI secretion system protein ImpC
MSGEVSFGRVDLRAEAWPDLAPERIGDAPPFRIAILGDFRAQHGGDAPARARGEAIAVDRDNLDAVMARLGVGLQLATVPGATPLGLSFRSVDDFHPDRLLETEPFRPLREARRRLSDPATFRAAAADLSFLAAAAPPAAEAPPPASSPEVAAGSPGLLDQILKQTLARAPASADEDRAWRTYLDRITAGHVVSKDPRQDEAITAVDAATTGLLRAILHHPTFQSLEATWRGVDRLTRELETGQSLTIELVDVSRAALEADLVSTTPLDSTATCKRLLENSVDTEGSQPWALLVGLFTVEPSARDVALLWRLGQVARLAGAPLVAAASPRFVGCAALAATPDPDDWSAPPTIDGWADLRRSDEAPFLGLALPRVIVRAPYGARSHPIDAFPFEELEATPAHDDYLWGNPALAVALVLGRAVAASGRAWTESYDPEIGDLPQLLEEHAGGPSAKPCAEALLGQRAVDRLLDAGLLPVVSIRHRDAVRLAQLRSIAEPPAALAVRCE